MNRKSTSAAAMSIPGREGTVCLLTRFSTIDGDGFSRRRQMHKS